MDLGIAGLRVLVTAGADGIGREIARAFLGEGAKVHVCDVDEKALARLEHSDPEITQSRADVADRDEVARLFDEAVGVLGGLDVLVNNAGIAGPTGRVEDIAPAEWDRCLAVNISGQFNCARLAVPHLRKSKNASIVNLSSAAGRLGFPMRTAYSASKWAVVGFTKSLAIELGPAGIRVNAIQPGIVEGDRIRRVFEAKAKARAIGRRHRVHVLAARAHDLRSGHLDLRRYADAELTEGLVIAPARSRRQQRDHAPSGASSRSRGG